MALRCKLDVTATTVRTLGVYLPASSRRFILSASELPALSSAMEKGLELAEGSKSSRLLSSFFRRLARATLKLTNGMIQRLLLEIQRITLTTTDSIRLGRTVQRLDCRSPNQALITEQNGHRFLRGGHFDLRQSWQIQTMHNTNFKDT
jgi:hypothetical protein